MIDVRITDTPLELSGLVAFCSDDASGGIATFLGVARNSSSMREGAGVVRLEYEAYIPMAERELAAIAHEATERFAVNSVAVHHRLGRLEIGESAVVAAVGAPHRAAAFDACRYVIEELKKRVPIWKREVFHDGGEWVNARP